MPLDITRNEIEEHASSAAFFHFADVMKPDIPLIPSGTPECVGKAPGSEVALQNQYAFLFQPGQNAGRGQTANPGTDHDYIERAHLASFCSSI
jgi:hypothetical protein